LWTSSSLWMLNFPNYWNLDMDNIWPTSRTYSNTTDPLKVTYVLLPKIILGSTSLPHAPTNTSIIYIPANMTKHSIINTIHNHPTTWYYALYHANMHDIHHPDNTIPSCLLPRTCYALICICLARLRPNILCTHPNASPPFYPNNISS
jgi:hypothetical protein